MRYIITLFTLLVGLSLNHFGQKNQSTEKSAPMHSSESAWGVEQSFAYSFQHEQRPYAKLEDGVELGKGINWNNIQLKVPLGFTFTFFEEQTDTLYIMETPEGAILGLNPEGVSAGPVMVFFGADLMDRSMDSVQGTNALSPILLETIGEEGERITSVEWQNVGFQPDITANNSSTDYANFQIHIYEETGNLEVHFGDSHFTQPKLLFKGQNGPSLGLVQSYNYDQMTIQTYGYWVTGFPYLPSTIISPSQLYLDGNIPDGTVYRFERTSLPTSVEEVKDQLFAAYPNPSQGLLEIEIQGKLSATWAEVYSMDGKKVYEQDIQAVKAKMDLSQLQKGAYILRLRTATATLGYQKIIMQ
ncbi:MAG: T9SS type A sorting domain-containing protein [Bacteroidota bacterium]